jgi:hypothetical protein
LFVPPAIAVTVVIFVAPAALTAATVVSSPSTITQYFLFGKRGPVVSYRD